MNQIKSAFYVIMHASNAIVAKIIIVLNAQTALNKTLVLFLKNRKNVLTIVR